MQPQEIINRFSILETSRFNIEAAWDDIERYIQPIRLGDFFQKPQMETSINWNREEIYDTVGMVAAGKFASSLHGAMVNSNMDWLGAEWRNPVVAKDVDANRWLQDLAELHVNELNDSNFDSELGSAIKDTVALGNTCMTLEPEQEIKTSSKDWEGYNFATWATREFYFEQDHRGRLAIAYRRLQWTPRQIQTKFQGIKLPESIERLINDAAQIDVRVDIIYCIYYRPDKRNNLGNLGTLAESERPVGSRYILRNGAVEIGEERGLYEFPAFVGRWEKASGSMWGYGPGNLAAPTCKYINNWMQMEDISARKQIDSPTLVSERGLMSDLNLAPGGMTLVRDVEKSVKAFNPGGNMDLSMKKLDELRAMVKQIFFEDLLMMGKADVQMSATEAQIREDQTRRLLGPNVARLHYELLNPLNHRGFRLLIRNGQIRPPPAIVIENNAQWKFTYAGPLMRAQKADNATATERWMGSVGGAAKVLPKILNRVNEGNVALKLARDLGVDENCVRSDAEVAAIEQQQNAHALQMAKAQAAQATGDAQQSLNAAQAPQQGQPAPAPGANMMPTGGR